MAKAEAVKQYLFISRREINVGSLSGRSILFEKNVPTHVPREMHSEVMEKGILPCDKDGNVLDDVTDVEVAVSATPLILVAPEDPAEREEKISAAIFALADRNARGDFTAGGVPHDKAVSAALGWTVEAREVRAVWAKVKPEVMAKRSSE